MRDGTGGAQWVRGGEGGRGVSGGEGERRERGEVGDKVNDNGLLFMQVTRMSEGEAGHLVARVVSLMIETSPKYMPRSSIALSKMSRDLRRVRSSHSCKPTGRTFLHTKSISFTWSVCGGGRGGRGEGRGGLRGCGCIDK